MNNMLEGKFDEERYENNDEELIPFTDTQSHSIQNEIDNIMDLVRKYNDDVLLTKLETLRDSIPCTCGET